MKLLEVVLLGRIASLGREALERQLTAGRIIASVPDPRAASEFPGVFEAADVIVGGPFTEAIAARALRLKLVHIPGAGLDGMGLHLLPGSIPVANAFHHERSIAEYVFMAMLHLSQRPDLADRRLRGGLWAGFVNYERPAIESLAGSAVLILGFGHIGKEVAKRAEAFDMEAIPVTRATTGWRERLKDARYVVISCPLNETTRGMIGETEFGLMRRDAVLINVARGPVVDEGALFEALRTRSISAAAIDVWYSYPREAGEVCLPSQYPFHELDNVLMTPHISGWTNLTVEGRMRDVADNVARLAAGEPLRNIVNGGD
jgi:phosphoglycerate dehydrogenase-like enzyme